MLVQVRLADGGIVRRHLDQLHPREGKGEVSPQTEGDDDVAKIGDDAVETNNSESTTSNPNTSTSTEPPPPESVSLPMQRDCLLMITLRVGLRNL